MNKFIIDDVRQLYWVLLVLVCAAVAVYGFAMKRRALAAFASRNLLGALAGNVSRRRQIVKTALVLSAMCAIIMALVGPRYGAYFEDVLRRKLDVVICLDVSRSMSAEDAGMSRLDRAKDDIKRLLDKLQGGAIGLVVFAGRADLACPLTDDFDFFRIALEDVGTHSVSVGGTDIGKALDAAIKALGDRGGRHRAIVVMSDGEDHGTEAVAQATRAKDEKIPVYTIGIGDQQRGALIPVVERGQKRYLMHEGTQVWSKMDPATLQRIAEAGGGEYHPSGQVKAGLRTLEWIYQDRLAPLQEADLQKKRVPSQRAQFAWFAALALVLLMIETLVSERTASGATAGAAEDANVARGNGRSVSKRSAASSFAAVIVSALVLMPADARAEDRGALRTAAGHNEEGNRLLVEGRFDEALGKYDAARAALPNSAELAYNRGLALYHLGRYAEAQSAFQDALKPGNLELEAKAKYNLGRCAHAAGMEKAKPETLAEAVDDLGRAIGFYNDALQLSPKDADAAGNRDAADRLRRYLELWMEEQKQEKANQDENQDKDDSQKQEAPSSQPDSQEPTSQPESQPSDQSQQEQGDEQSEEQGEEQGEEQESDQEGDQNQDEQQKAGKDSSKQSGAGDQKPSDEQRQAQSGEEREDQMTEQQAESMLQEARDAEQRRRAAKRQAMIRAQGRVRVEKDW